MKGNAGTLHITVTNLLVSGGKKTGSLCIQPLPSDPAFYKSDQRTGYSYHCCVVMIIIKIFQKK